MDIEFLRAADRDELLDFLYSVFTRNNPNHPRFENLYPDIFLATDEAMKDHAVIRENGKIASCVGAYHMTLQIAGCRVPIVGVGQVSTGAAALGKGYFSAILKAQIERVTREGAALLWLGGRQDRYAHFGIEGGCATNLLYCFDKHSTAKIPVTLDISSVPAKDPGSVSDEMFRLREQTVDGIIEPLERYRRRFARSQNATIWTARRPGSGELLAWAWMGKEHIHDWCGDPDAKLQLAAKFAQSAEKATYRTESPWDTAVADRLRPYCDWVGTSSNQLSVLNLKALLDAFRPIIPAGAPLPDESLGPAKLARMLFGPEPGPFHLPFLLQDPFHV